MTQPGYQAGSEPMWWWKVAQHLDDAQLALSNAMAHNVDDPRPVQALYTRLREGQAILLDIFRMKGLLPAEPPAPVVPMPGGPMPGPMAGMPMPAMAGMPMAGMPMPPGPPPGVPWFGAPGSDGPPPSPYFAEQGPPLVHDDPAVPPADHAAAASEAEPPLASASNGVPPTTITSEPSAPVAPAGSSTEGVGG